MSDNSELKRLAEAATPGRNFDRLPLAGGGLKYECTGDDGSLVLKVDHKNDEWGFVGNRGEQDEAFFLACTPAAVLTLIAENERLKSNVESLRDGCHSLNGALTNTESARVETLAELRKSQSEKNKLKAELAKLRKLHSSEMDQLKAEVEVLRRSIRNVYDSLEREYWSEYAGLDDARAILDCAMRPDTE